MATFIRNNVKNHWDMKIKGQKLIKVKKRTKIINPKYSVKKKKYTALPYSKCILFYYH